jgi:hypothetical protein
MRSVLRHLWLSLTDIVPQLLDGLQGRYLRRHQRLRHVQACRRALCPPPCVMDTRGQGRCAEGGYAVAVQSTDSDDGGCEEVPESVADTE